MNPHRMKALEGLLDYLSGLQGGDLKGLLDKPEDPLAALSPEGAEESEDLEVGGGSEKKPKGISIEKVSILGKDKPMGGLGEELTEELPEKLGEELPEMAEGAPSDDEIEQLYNRMRK